MRALRGPIAQLGERRVRNAEVVSSILIRSTTISEESPETSGLFSSAAPRGGVPERSKGSDCKSDGTAFEGSNPSPSTTQHPPKGPRESPGLFAFVGRATRVSPSCPQRAAHAVGATSVARGR